MESLISSSRSPEGEEKDQANISHSAAEIRDVFGDSDEEDAEEYAIRNDMDQDSNVSIDVSKKLHFLLCFLTLQGNM